MPFTPPLSTSINAVLASGYEAPNNNAIYFSIDDGTAVSFGKYSPPEIIIQAQGTVTAVGNAEYCPSPPNVESSGESYVNFGAYVPPIAEIVATGSAPIVAWGNFVPPAVEVRGSDLVYFNAGQYAPKIPVMRGVAASHVSLGNYNPPLPEIAAVGTNSIICTGRFKPPKVVVKGTEYAGELAAHGQYSPKAPVINAHGGTGVYGWGDFSCKVPVIHGLGTVTVTAPGVTGVGRYSPNLPIISGLSLPVATGSIRFVPPMVKIEAHGGRVCLGAGSFIPDLPRIKSRGTSGAEAQGVFSFPHVTSWSVASLPGSMPSDILGYDRETVVPVALSPSPITTPLSFSRL